MVNQFVANKHFNLQSNIFFANLIHVLAVSGPEYVLLCVDPLIYSQVSIFEWNKKKNK